MVNDTLSDNKTEHLKLGLSQKTRDCVIIAAPTQKNGGMNPWLLKYSTLEA